MIWLWRVLGAVVMSVFQSKGLTVQSMAANGPAAASKVARMGGMARSTAHSMLSVYKLSDWRTAQEAMRHAPRIRRVWDMLAEELRQSIKMP